MAGLTIQDAARRSGRRPGTPGAGAMARRGGGTAEAVASRRVSELIPLQQEVVW